MHKLQLIKDAKRICPDVVIVLGEDLTRFRDASKALYGFLQAFSWSRKVERLGFDEVSLPYFWTLALRPPHFLLCVHVVVSNRTKELAFSDHKQRQPV